MNPMVKKAVSALILLIIALVAVTFIFAKKEEKAASKEKDYEKIELLNSALSHTIAKYTPPFGNQAAWYVYDARVIYEKDDTFHKELQKELGKDFDPKLSTGDYLGVGVLPLYNKYRIYVGDPGDMNNMVYPEWKSTKLPQK